MSGVLDKCVESFSSVVLGIHVFPSTYSARIPGAGFFASDVTKQDGHDESLRVSTHVSIILLLRSSLYSRDQRTRRTWKIFAGAEKYLSPVVVHVELDVVIHNQRILRIEERDGVARTVEFKRN